jgi:hypothetical protein
MTDANLALGGYTILDLVRSFNLSRSYWYEQIALGNLEAVKLGKRSIILAPALKAFLDALPAARSTYIRKGSRRIVGG